MPCLLKFRRINFHEFEQKREIHENLATQKFPSIWYVHNWQIHSSNVNEIFIAIFVWNYTILK